MKKKRMTAALLGAALAASMILGACGQSGGQGGAGNTGSAKESEPEGSTAEEGGNSSGQETVGDISQITFPLEEKVTLTAYVYATNTGGGTMKDNYVTDWIEEQTNVRIDFIYDLDGDEAKTKLNLLMSDPDSMPDIFWRTGWTKSELNLYGQQGLVIPLNDYVKTAPNWNYVNEISPMRKGDLTMTDGNIYCFGSEGESFHNIYQNRMWIYKPWVDELNDGKVPETLDELYDYLVKVKESDPNGNGKADEIPLSGFLGGWSTDPTVWIINSFLQCNNPLSNTNPTVGAGMIIQDGQIKFQFVEEQYKEAMKFLNRLYAEGLLDSQVFTQDETQFKAQLDNEEHLVALHAGGMMQCDTTGLGIGPGEYQNWVALEPVEGPEGVRLAARSASSYFGGCNGVISRNCKNPEIAIALFDWLMNEEPTHVQAYGPKGVTWDFVDGGPSLGGDDNATWKIMTVPADEIDWAGLGYDKTYNDDNINWPSDAYICNLSAGVRAAQLVEHPEIDLEAILQEAAERYEQYSPAEDTLVPDIPFDDEAAKKIADYTLTIGGYVNQATVQFITGDMDIEAEWGNFVDRLNQMGLEDYMRVYQESYDQYMENLDQ